MAQEVDSENQSRRENDLSNERAVKCPQRITREKTGAAKGKDEGKGREQPSIPDVTA